MGWEIGGPLLTFCLGLILGHWLALGRDKRKEFNEAAAPMRVWLLEAQEQMSYSFSIPSRSVIDAFTVRLSERQRRKFNVRWRALTTVYGETISAQNQSWITFKDHAKVREALEELVPFTDLQ